MVSRCAVGNVKVSVYTYKSEAEKNMENYKPSRFFS